MTSRIAVPQNDGGGEGGRSTSQFFQLGHQPALDGLRGMAIILVIASHALPLNDAPGFIGVNIFFVLSGFLITSLLIEEWRQSGRISLRDFYARRALRLLPALFLLLTVFLLYGYLVHPRKKFLIDLKEILVAVGYCANWASAFKFLRLEYLSHTWSLSIEEQFYFLWPVLLLLLLRKARPRWLLAFILVATLASCVARELLFFKYFATPDDAYIRLSRGLDTRADSLLLGCAASVLLHFNLLSQSDSTSRWVQIWGWFSVIGLVWIGCVATPDEDLMCRFGWFFISLFSALLILYLVNLPNSRLAGFFKLPTLVSAGKISYGLYLWNWPVSLLVGRQDWPVWKQAVVNICFTTLFAMASYHMVELRFLRLKKRFEHGSRKETTPSQPVVVKDPLQTKEPPPE